MREINFADTGEHYDTNLLIGSDCYWNLFTGKKLKVKKTIPLLQVKANSDGFYMEQLKSNYGRRELYFCQKQLPRLLCKKGVLRNFTKFTGIHLYQSLFFNKVTGLKPASLLKKRLWHNIFPVNFVKFLRRPFLQNTSGRLVPFCKQHSSRFSYPDQPLK